MKKKYSVIRRDGVENLHSHDWMCSYEGCRSGPRRNYTVYFIRNNKTNHWLRYEGSKGYLLSIARKLNKQEAGK